MSPKKNQTAVVFEKLGIQYTSVPNTTNLGVIRMTSGAFLVIGPVPLEYIVPLTDTNYRYSRYPRSIPPKGGYDEDTLVPRENNKPKSEDITITKRIRTIPPPKKTKRDALVEFWNELPYVSRHLDPTSKRYKKASSLLRQLRRGVLHRNEFSTTFLTRHRIPEGWLKRKWSKRAIQNGLEELSKMYQPGYWPRDKSWIPRDLGTLIYNPMSQNSWFLAVKVHSVQTLAELGVEKNPTARKITTVLKGSILEASPAKKTFSADEDRDLLLLSRELQDFYITLPVDQWGEIKRVLPTAIQLAKEYGQWIEKNLTSPQTRFLGTKKRTFQRFIEELGNSIGIQLHTGKLLKGE